MRKLFALLVIVFCISGCWKYSTGTTIGYITTVEGGIFWDTVYIRAELESSQTDAYAIAKDNWALKDALIKSSRAKQRVEVLYIKHVIMLRNGLSDEVKSFTVL